MILSKKISKNEILNSYKIAESSNLFSNKKKKIKINKILIDNRIERDFFMTNAVSLSKKLLGKILIRKLGEEILKCRIVEVEAYMGTKDKGSHTYNDRKTERTKYYWLQGGHLNVYLIYGTNHCFNIIANVEEKPQGCLIRAVEPIEGIEIISQNRQLTNKKKYVHSIYNLTNGPGKVCSALQIDRTYNGHDICNSNEIFLIHDPGYQFKIKSSPRINIDYAEEYKEKLWRFFIKNNPYVSKHKFNY